MGDGKSRTLFYLTGLALLVAYSVVSFSPLREIIGRREPGVAALFSPPWFNFGATFASGTVLEFRVGMNRLDLAKVLKGTYAKDSVLLGDCSDKSELGASDLRIDSDEGKDAMMKKNVLCLWQRSKRLMIIVTIKGDSVSYIRVALVNNGL